MCSKAFLSTLQTCPSPETKLLFLRDVHSTGGCVSQKGQGQIASPSVMPLDGLFKKDWINPRASERIRSFIMLAVIFTVLASKTGYSIYNVEIRNSPTKYVVLGALLDQHHVVLGEGVRIASTKGLVKNQGSQKAALCDSAVTL
jgi:hypothetical protein